MIEILNRYTKVVLYRSETAVCVKSAVLAATKSGEDLRDADLRGAYLGDANLGGANLRDADLRDADLRDAYLGYANLGGANLYGAYLGGANLYGANLYGANLYGANLRDANLGGANLRDAYLGDANLRDANLRDADLRDADLRDAYLGYANLGGAVNAELALAAVSICPDGAIIGYKKTSHGVVKLRIPEEAKRSNATGRKCRAEFAVVLETPNHEPAFSEYDRDFIYREGAIIRPTQPFDENRWEECASGIHFYITREEAEAHR